MRKAVQAAAMGRRSRGRKGEDAPGAGGSSLTAPASPQQQGSSAAATSVAPPAQPTANGVSTNISSNGGGGVNGMISLSDNTRRKATPEEAALTAKNYRLAKELSELRVRHREETKNVNRLTMENMNLASRCREAISHVGMLKKELATLQQQQHKKNVSQDASLSTASSSRSTGSSGRKTPNRNSSNKSPPPQLLPKSPLRPPEAAPLPTNLKPHTGRALDMSREMDQMDQLLAKRSVNSNKPNRPLRAGDIALTPSATPIESEDADDDDPLSDLPKAALSPPNNQSFFPHSASPKLGRVGNYNEEFPGDITSVSRLNSRQRVAALGGFAETAEEEPTTSGSGDKNESVSSIDAFEASFTTNFPDSFSPTASAAGAMGNNGKDFTKPTNSAVNESAAYNPFSTSPQNTSSLPSTNRRAADSLEPGQTASKPQIRLHRDPPGRNRTSLRTTTAGAFSPTLVSPSGSRSNRSSITSPSSISGKETSSPPLSNGKRHVSSTPPTKNALDDYATPPSAGIDSPGDRPSPLSRYEKAIQNKPNLVLSNIHNNYGTSGHSPDSREPRLTTLDQKLSSSKTPRKDASAISLDERRRARTRGIETAARSLDGSFNNPRDTPKRDRPQQDSPAFEENKVDATPPRVTLLPSPKDFVNKTPPLSLSDAFGEKRLDSEEKKSDSGMALDSPMSVKDRAAMFSSDRSPRSPEAEQARIMAVSSPTRTQHVRANSLDQVASPRSDIGDIPMVSSLKRTIRSFPTKSSDVLWGDEEASGSLASAEAGY